MSGDDATPTVELLYQQRMTVELPAGEIPETPDDVLHLIKNTDPQMIPDLLPNQWDDAMTVGSLTVLDVAVDQPHEWGEER
jgi:hypothetical protein